MSKEHLIELESIKKDAAALEADFTSKDPNVVKRVDAQLQEIDKRLEAWGKKYNIQFTTHTEEDRSPVARRRCKSYIDVEVGGVPQDCFLIGRKRFNCLYKCINQTANPFE
jgi:hypothetical protein